MDDPEDDSFYDNSGSQDGGQDWKGDWSDFFQKTTQQVSPNLALPNPTGSSTVDQIGAIVTGNTNRTPLTIDTSWIGNEDMDFWNWFWQWYFELEDSWTYDHEANRFEKALSWSWFQTQTRGNNSTLDAIIIDFNDSEQWTWTGWNKFWSAYITSETPIGALTSKKKPVQGDEDHICENGYFPNSKNNFCLKCPAGCEACDEVNRCYECANNFELVFGPSFGYCYPKCYNSMYRVTEFETDEQMLKNFGLRTDVLFIPAAISPQFMMWTCKICPGACRQCFSPGMHQALPTCFECENGYTPDTKSGFCKRDPLYNDDPDSIIRIYTEEQDIQKCDDVKMFVRRVNGVMTQPLDRILWYIDMVGAYPTLAMKAMIMEVTSYFKDSDIFLLPRILTEMVTEETWFKITVTLHDSQAIYKDSQIIKVRPEPYTQVAVVESTQYLIASEDINFEFVLLQARCGTQQIFDLNQDDYDSLTCHLYDNKRNLIAHLDECMIPFGTMNSSSVYFVEVNFKANSYQKTQVEMIRVITQTEKTFCNFPEGSSLMIDPKTSHTLIPTIFGHKEYADNYYWTCTLTGTKTICPQVSFNRLNTSLSFTITPNVLNIIPKDKSFDFNLVLTRNNNGIEQYIDNCTMTYLTFFPTKDYAKVVEMKVKSNTAEIGFLDYSQNQKFYCSPANEADDDLNDILDYKLTITDQTTYGQIGVAPSEYLATVKDKVLVVSAEFFKLNHNYTVVCKATSSSRKVIGLVSRQYDTLEFTEDFWFNTTTLDGSNTAYYSTFVLTVLKPISEALNCEFGYLNSVGMVTIEDTSGRANLYTSQKQQVYTALPMPDGYGNVLTTYCRCKDEVGRFKTKTVSVTLSEDPTGRDLPPLKANVPQRTSDIVLFAKQMKDSKDQVQAVMDITNAITSTSNAKRLTTDQISQLSVVMGGISNSIASQSSSVTDKSSYNNMATQSFNALNAILTSNTHDDVPSIDKTTFGNLGAAIDSLYLYSLTSDENIFKLAQNTQQQLFESGIDMVQGSIDDMYIGLNFPFKNYNIQLQKMKNSDFKSKGSIIEINAHRVEIPYDPLFEKTKNIVFAAMFTEKVPTQSELYKNLSDKDRFLSGQFTLNARSSSNEIQSSSNNKVNKIDVQNMAKPIRISLQNDQPDQPSTCAYFNENFNLWQPIQKCDEGSEDSTNVICCSSHLTTFALLKSTATQNIMQEETVTYTKRQRVPQEKKIPEQAPPAVQKPIMSQKESVTYSGDYYSQDQDVYINETYQGFGRGSIVIIVVNVIMISLMIAGFMMDRNQRKKDADEKAQEVEMGQDHYSLTKQENSAEVTHKVRKVLSSGQNATNVSEPELGVFKTPIDGVVEAAARTVVDPVLLNKQNGLDIVEGSPNFESDQQAANSGRQVEETFRASDPAMLRSSGIELQFDENMEQRSEVSLGSRVMKQIPLENPVIRERTVPTCKSVYVNALKYYNRCASMLINIPDAAQQWPRAFKVIIVLTQYFIGASCIGAFVMFDEKEMAVGITFVIMRLVQGLFGIMKPHQKSAIIRYVAIVGICVLNVLCQAIVYICMQKSKPMLKQSLLMLGLEVLVWDTALVPLLMLLGWKVSLKFANYFSALKK